MQEKLDKWMVTKLPSDEVYCQRIYSKSHRLELLE